VCSRLLTILKLDKILLIVAIPAITFSLVFYYGGINFSADADLDEIPDSSDNCPDISNPLQDDYDKDGLGDICDPDDDNDKVVDAVDVFDNDPNEWADFDFDGVGSNQDTDDDNDGILDEKDPMPIPISEKLTQQYMTEIEICILEDGTNRLLCYGDFFDSLVEQEVNNENPLKLASALQQIGALDDCHFISHRIGHASFDETLNLNLKNFDVYGLLCRGGYFHGAMGAFFHNLKDNNEPVPDNYKIICDDLIGTIYYSVCVHGLGHGLINYYPTNLESALDYCYQMSYFQDNLCTSGAMMQYTDNQLTEFGATKENISNMCSESELSKFEFETCSKNIGVSLAFHNNHEADISLKFCLLIDNEKGREFCVEGLSKEILKFKGHKQGLFIEKEFPKLQPQWIKQEGKKWIVDFYSSATISDFDYIEETKEMQFSVDAPKIIKIYTSSELLPEKLVVTINGVHEKNVKINYDEIEDITKIMIVPTKSGTVLISSG